MTRPTRSSKFPAIFSLRAISAFLALPAISILPALLGTFLFRADLHSQQTAHRITLNPVMEMQYLLYLPETYNPTGEREFPLLLFLHGGGEAGDDIEKVKTHGPPKLIEQGKEFSFIVLSPQNPHPRRWWNETALITLLNEIQATYRVDEDRIYLAGLSRGGYGAWRMAALYPERFAALVAICGETPDHYAHWIGQMPVWVFHGADDRTISVRESDEMVAALKAHGNAVRYTRYEDTGHDAWTKTFADPELYEWMLNQKKQREGEYPASAEGLNLSCP